MNGEKLLIQAHFKSQKVLKKENMGKKWKKGEFEENKEYV